MGRRHRINLTCIWCYLNLAFYRSDCKCNFKYPVTSMKLWQFPIYNETPKSFVWSNQVWTMFIILKTDIFSCDFSAILICAFLLMDTIFKIKHFKSRKSEYIFQIIDQINVWRISLWILHFHLGTEITLTDVLLRGVANSSFDNYII